MDPLAISRDPLRLHPSLRGVLLSGLLPELQANGLPLALYEAARAPERQVYLYNKGRVAGFGDLGGTVTHSVAWHSKHQYGLAVDLVFFIGNRWTWNEPRPGAWAAYQTIAKKYGLEPILRRDGSVLEWPHVQSTWPLVKLLNGEYPPDGDESWSAWFNGCVDAWGAQPRKDHGYEHPGAPPPYRGSDPERPPLDAPCFTPGA